MTYNYGDFRLKRVAKADFLGGIQSHTVKQRETWSKLDPGPPNSLATNIILLQHEQPGAIETDAVRDITSSKDEHTTLLHLKPQYTRVRGLDRWLRGQEQLQILQRNHV